MSSPSVQPGQVITLESVYGTDATTITFGVVNGAGSTVLAPTSVGIAHPGVGLYLYSWAVPADEPAGTYTAVWNATFGSTPSLVTQPFQVSQPGGTGTWCTPSDIAAFTGQSGVTQANLVVAQGMLEALIHRVWRPTDALKRDFYWLTRATAWQAVYVAAHPELLTMMDVQSLSQDGLSITFKQAGNSLAMYSPIALRFLSSLFRGSNTTIRLNSAFQKNRPLRGQLAGNSAITWKPL
jgi:hypothetical protein